MTRSENSTFVPSVLSRTQVFTLLDSNRDSRCTVSWHPDLLLCVDEEEEEKAVT